MNRTTHFSSGEIPFSDGKTVRKRAWFSKKPDAVTGTMVAGKWLMRDRNLLTLDESAIAARARELSSRVWDRYRRLAR
ncbi:hypothetical protein JXA40_05860 [bacterium]|nr:hypothetical protein [candidate division CSSED10-310 bacterium]